MLTLGFPIFFKLCQVIAVFVHGMKTGCSVARKVTEREIPRDHRKLHNIPQGHMITRYCHVSGHFDFQDSPKLVEWHV